jgi:glycosyltransferase involved in cell wall biosynthesis
MISFIIPAHNEERELPQTIEAIQRAAQTTGRPFEIIVVDDSSTDATGAIAAKYGAGVVSVHSRHIAAARNAGARVSRGEILFFVDADTRITARHITAATNALAEGCSGGSARLRFDGTVPFWALVFFKMFCAVYFTANLGAGAFLFTSRQNFVAAGGFDEQYFAAEETHLSMALKKFGPFRILAEPAITSGRKVRMHRARYVLGQSLAIMFGGQRALRSREKLGLWYDGKRERTAL